MPARTLDLLARPPGSGLGVSRASPGGGLSSRWVVSRRVPWAVNLCRGQSAGSPGVALQEEDDLKKWRLQTAGTSWLIRGSGSSQLPAGTRRPWSLTVPRTAGPAWPRDAGAGHSSPQPCDIGLRFSMNQALLLLLQDQLRITQIRISFLFLSRSQRSGSSCHFS